MPELGEFDPHATYDAASLQYADASKDFWIGVSQRTVELVGPAPGERVLDAACGPGWSAIEAARRVGPEGRVLAVDYSPRMLALAREQASNAGVQDIIEWREADMATLDEPATYDAVLCVLGLFFVEDMTAQVRRFIQLLRPGGRLGIGALGAKVFTPLVDELRRDVASARPDLDWTLPWERLSDPHRLQTVLADAGARDIRIVEEANPAPLRDPGDWWRMVLGSGLRRYVTEVGTREAERIRRRHTNLIQDRAIDSVDLDIIAAVARAPA